MTDGTTPSDKVKFPYKEAFDRLPDVMEELLNHMSDLEGQIGCINEGNDSVLAEYEARQQQILHLRTTIANFDAENEALAQRIGDLHEKWHPEVLQTVSVINANFSQYMSAMRFAGEVELVHNEPVSVFFSKLIEQIRILISFFNSVILARLRRIRYPDSCEISQQRKDADARSKRTIRRRTGCRHRHLLSVAAANIARSVSVRGRDQPGHGFDQRAQDLRNAGRTDRSARQVAVLLRYAQVAAAIELQRSDDCSHCV